MFSRQIKDAEGGKQKQTGKGKQAGRQEDTNAYPAELLSTASSSRGRLTFVDGIKWGALAVQCVLHPPTVGCVSLLGPPAGHEWFHRVGHPEGPAYSTVQSGPRHLPTFTTTVLLPTSFPAADTPVIAVGVSHSSQILSCPAVRSAVVDHSWPRLAVAGRG